jgi:hypothetical protein
MVKKLKIQLTDPQFEVLKSISELSGDTIDEYLLAVVIQGLQSDIELYLGRSKNVTEIMHKKLGVRPFGNEEEEEEEKEEEEAIAK